MLAATLPCEILDQVLEHFEYDVVALKTFAIVHRSWTFSAQRLLWRTPRITASNFRRWLACQRERASFSACVRKLVININLAALGVHEEDLVGIDPEDFPELSAAMRNMPTLCVENHAPKRHTKAIQLERPLWLWLISLNQSCTIRSLLITLSREVDWQIVYHLLSETCTSLEELFVDVKQVHLLNLPGTKTNEFHCPRLRSITITTSTYPVQLYLFVRTVLLHVDAPNLENLAITCSVPRDSWWSTSAKTMHELSLIGIDFDDLLAVRQQLKSVTFLQVPVEDTFFQQIEDYCPKLKERDLLRFVSKHDINGLDTVLHD